MSVLDKESIDAVAITSDGVGIKLLISDHLVWTDEYEHLLLLQEKINGTIASPGLLIFTLQLEIVTPAAEAAKSILLFS